MNKLLIVLPFSSNDAVLLERNLDHCYRLNGKTAIGHCLLVANPDVHQEMRKRIQITAELAFESVTETIAPKLEQQHANNKFLQLNNLFRHAAMTAQNQCRWPWLWLEPDCVPVAPNWIEQLSDEYERQPKKYMGLIATNDAKQKFMARVGIYYGAASYELGKLCEAEVPFPLATAEKVVPSASHTSLIDYLNIETVEDLAKISPKAVIVHGDKMGIFAENYSASDNKLEGFLNSPVAKEFTISPEEHDRIARDNFLGLQNFKEAEKRGADLLQAEKDRISREVAAMGESCSEKAAKHGLVCALDSPQLSSNDHKQIESALKIIRGEITTSGTVSAFTKGDTITEPPRLTRRQKRELEQAVKSSKLDCVATAGCKTSTEVKT